MKKKSKLSVLKNLISFNSKRQWANPTIRRKMLLGMKKAWDGNLVRKKLIGSHRVRDWKNKKYRENVINSIKRNMSSKNSKKRCRKLILKVLNKIWKDPEYRKEFLIKRGKSQRTLKYRKKRSLIARKNWKKSKYVSRQMKSRLLKPNKSEKYLSKILNIIIPKHYKFVGDGKFILGGKCPDFLNINGQKKVIELYGDYWHKGQNPKHRINLFKKFGFKTLIIWEKELKNIKSLEKRILSFDNSKDKIEVCA